MQYTTLGNSGIRVSRLCLGCMSFGDPASKMHAWTLDPEQSEAVIKRALDLGINFFDTANTYPPASKTDVVARGKYDKTEEQDKAVAARICELAQKYGASMTQITLAWHFKKGIASPIIGATKEKYLLDAAGAFDVSLTEEDVAYIDELYAPHAIVGAL